MEPISLRRKVSRGLMESPSQDEFCINIQPDEKYPAHKPPTVTRFKTLFTIIFTLTAAFTMFWAGSMCYQLHLESVALNSAQQRPGAMKRHGNQDTQLHVHPIPQGGSFSSSSPGDTGSISSSSSSSDANSGAAGGGELVASGQAGVRPLMIEPQVIDPDASAEAPDAELIKEERDLQLSQEIQALEKKLRDMKASGVVVAHDTQAQILAGELQSLAKEISLLRYGPGPYYVEIVLSLPEIMLTGDRQKSQVLTMETASLDDVPYSVYMWLDTVRRFKGGAFHRNAGHVLQALLRKNRKAMAFQEYSPNFPHKQWTMGYAGRPGGPAFYISIEDNTRNHGPGSQGSETEADGCFGRLADQASIDVAKLIHTQPGAGNNGFITPRSNWIDIVEMKIVAAPARSSLRGV